MNIDLYPSASASHRRKPRAAVLLGATALLAPAAPLAAGFVAFSPAPLTTMIQGASSPGAQHAGATLSAGDPCQVAVRLRTPATFKLPLCAGD